GFFLFQNPPSRRVFAQVIAQAKILSDNSQIQVRLAKLVEKNRHGAGLSGAADVAEREGRNARSAVGSGQVFIERLHVQAGIGQTDVAMPRDRTPNTNETVRAPAI